MSTVNKSLSARAREKLQQRIAAKNASSVQSPSLHPSSTQMPDATSAPSTQMTAPTSAPSSTQALTDAIKKSASSPKQTHSDEPVPHPLAADVDKALMASVHESHPTPLDNMNFFEAGDAASLS